MDGTPSGKKFGDVLVQPLTTPYSAGQTVLAKFQGANPRVRRSTKHELQRDADPHSTQNNLHLEGTFLSVERQNGTTWAQYRSDSHPSTKFSWLRTGGSLSATSEVNVTWFVFVYFIPSSARIDVSMQDHRAGHASWHIPHRILWRLEAAHWQHLSVYGSYKLFHDCMNYCQQILMSWNAPTQLRIPLQFDLHVPTTLVPDCCAVMLVRLLRWHSLKL